MPGAAGIMPLLRFRDLSAPLHFTSPTVSASALYGSVPYGSVGLPPTEKRSHAAF